MSKPSITLPDGTVITGTIDEVERLLIVHHQHAPKPPAEPQPRRKPTGKKTTKAGGEKATPVVDHTEIVNLIKNCDEADAIETQILDRASQVNRTLLPLYIVNVHFDNSLGLTSGDVNKITTDLGIPISTPNASRTLSGTAKRYVMGDKVRKQGQTTRYKLTRRGKTYIKNVLGGIQSGAEK